MKSVFDHYGDGPELGRSLLTCTVDGSHSLSPVAAHAIPKAACKDALGPFPHRDQRRGPAHRKAGDNHRALVCSGAVASTDAALRQGLIFAHKYGCWTP